MIGREVKRMGRQNRRRLGEELQRFHAEVNKENRIAIRLFAIAGLFLSLMVLFTQLVVLQGAMPLRYSAIMTVYFLLLLAYEHFSLPEDYPNATGLLYLLEAPVMILAILLGTVWDPTHQASTILLFLMTLPVFVLDRPSRSLAILATWAAAFIALCVTVKLPELRRIDIAHTLEFFVAAVALTNVMFRVRLESLQHLYKAEYQLEHDHQTGCLNRYALAKNAKSFIGRSVVILLADMDQFMLFNDFYGHQAGEAIMLFFTRTLMECFGEERTYHYSGDEFLCAIDGESPEWVRERMERCRKALAAYRYEDQPISLSCAFGYVTGTPSSPDEFREMIQLADIYAHMAKRTGFNGTKGDTFTQEGFRKGVIESNLTTHARASEVNQLTGLPGMSHFVARSDALLRNVADKSRQSVVGYFKLSHMRDFNSAFGYAQGDALIAEAAMLLQRCFKGRYLCYISGAQFGILCYREEVEPGLASLKDALYSYKAGFPVEFKAGFAFYTGTESMISLLDQARIAQKSIVNRPNVSYCFYDSRMDEQTQFQQYVVNHLDEAIENGWLTVYYQPIARAVTGCVCNEEALSRWIDPKYGFLNPGQFIPTLEENALMYKVNLNVIRQVLRDFRTKRDLGVPIVPVSVNLSRRDFEQCDMVREISDIVDASGFPRSLIKIEITESAFIENQELLKREVDRFREAGFEVWLDDFGSEYSTLNLLQELNFDLIKIDMKFMKNFSALGKNYIIISDIIDMAKRMGITTLIEGVENLEHYEILRRLGCEKIQGFLFNRPNSLEYIIDRALNRTGLRFEDPTSTSYYEDVGRVDLDEPLSLISNDSGPMVDNQTPAGILEVSGDACFLLRGTDVFVNTLRRAGVQFKNERGLQSRTQIAALPEAVRAAAAHCLDADGWVNATFSAGGSGEMAVYLCRVSEHCYQDRIAVLMVILRSHRQ